MSAYFFFLSKFNSLSALDSSKNGMWENGARPEIAKKICSYFLSKECGSRNLGGHLDLMTLKLA